MIFALAFLLVSPEQAAPCVRTARGEEWRPHPPGISIRRDMKDLPLTPDTTYDQVIAEWGAPYVQGPARALQTYPLETPGEYLWLSFECDAPRRLTRALLVKDTFNGEALELFNTLEITRHRRRDQIDFSANPSGTEINAAWGPPDAVSGSGIQSWHYRMENGEIALMSSDGVKVYVRFLPAE